MIPVSAAVADPVRGHTLSDLQGRLHGFLERSPQHNGDRLAGRLLPTQLSETPELENGSFHWLLIAEWLADSFGLSSTPAGRAMLDDLCWIQFCVYGLFRAQDDLVDGDVEDPLLAVEANQLLVEAAACAARHFEGTSLFWKIFRETIDSTSRAIVQLDRLQRSPDRVTDADLDLYVDLSACLKIAAAGVALAAGREREWTSSISPALDRVAVAAQILDDLNDIQGDLAGGRINYAAWYLGRPVFGTTPEAIAAVVASNLATTDRLDSLLAAARGLLVEAADLLSPAICPRAHAYLIEYGQGIGALTQNIEDSRRSLFAEGQDAA